MKASKPPTSTSVKRRKPTASATQKKSAKRPVRFAFLRKSGNALVRTMTTMSWAKVESAGHLAVDVQARILKKSISGCCKLGKASTDGIAVAGRSIGCATAASCRTVAANIATVANQLRNVLPKAAAAPQVAS